MISMVEVYLTLIREGRRQLADIPEHLRADVETKLNAADQPPVAT